MKKLMEQIIKFGIIGVISFLIDFGIFSLLNYGLHVNYLIAGFFGFVISVIFNYVMSMRYVFERKDNVDTRVEFVIFVVLSSIGLIINEVVIWGCVGGIYDHTAALMGLFNRDMAEMAGKVIATAIVMVYNFISRKIFLEKKE